MKFLNKNYFFKNNLSSDTSIHFDSIFDKFDNLNNFLEIEYLKKNVKNRKIISKIKKGITKTEKKNSLKRDKNNTVIQQYINVMVYNGNKNTILKNFNKSIELFFCIFDENNEEFMKYKNYSALNFLSNNFSEYNDFQYILDIFLPKYFCIFDIKTKKNNKKKRSLKKYRHDIVYIPEPKRLKNTLKIINTYSESFKHYNLWERLFWLFINLIIDDKKSFILKRRSFIYKKSVKFFINKKNK